MNPTSRKYSFKEDVWKTQTPESCYWAGFIAADGCLRKSGENCYSLKTSLHIQDLDHLKKLKEFCGYTGKIYFEKNSIVTLSIYSNNKWANDLKVNFEIVPRKTFTLKPPVFKTEKLKFCYILGFLDGDGCVYKNKKRGDISVSATGGSKEFMSWVHSNLYEKSQKASFRKTRRPKLKIDERNGAFVSCISGKKAEFLIEYFSQFEVPKLNRKWLNK